MRRILFPAMLVCIAYVGVLAESTQPSNVPSSPASIRAVVGLPGQLPGRAVRQREFAKVVFDSPVRVMGTWLQGVFLIEHDRDRMDRGEPCTHIYRLKDRTKPVVTFFCEHLHRKVSEHGSYTVKRVSTRPGAYELVEFQFEGSADGHGVPKAQ